MVVVVLSACVRQTGFRLEEAEQMIEWAPDSALDILNSIQPVRLKTDYDKALYGLLLTQSMIKNGFYPDNDSLISFSVDYFIDHNDTRRAAMAEYYRGRLNYELKSNSIAMVSYFRAKDIAEQIGEHFWAGMACRGISDIYSDTFNAAEQLNYAEKEYRHIRETGRQPYLNYALLDLGRSLHDSGENARAIDVAIQVADSAHSTGDHYLYVEALRLRSVAHMGKDELAEALSVLRQLCSDEHAEAEDSLRLCDVLITLGDVNGAVNLMDSVSGGDAFFRTMLKCALAEKSGNYMDAYKYIVEIDSGVSARIREVQSHDLSSSLVDYYGLRAKLDSHRVEAANSRFKMTVATFILLICILATGVAWMIRKHRIEIMQKVNLAKQLEESLTRRHNDAVLRHLEVDSKQKATIREFQESARQKDEFLEKYKKTEEEYVKSIEEYKNSLDISKEKLSQSEKVWKSLIAEKYVMVERLTHIVSSSEGKKGYEKKVAKAINEIIENMSVSGSRMAEFENDVNILHHNLYDDFKNDVPRLKPADCQLFLFSVLGLSSAECALLLKEKNMDSVYNRKRRLKNKIRMLDEPLQTKYLRWLM